jgi:ribonuclease Z
MTSICHLAFCLVAGENRVGSENQPQSRRNSSNRRRTMQRRFPFRTLEPTFFSGLLDDPVLYLFVRPLGRGILLDCGRIHHLAKRVMKSLSALFISHAHMDHFMGMDTFVRSVHVSPRTIDIFGPPGLSDKMACKLAGYAWNLTEAYWCSFRVHDVYADRIETALFSGPEAFARQQLGVLSRPDRTIYQNQNITVEAEECDHKIPSLIFKVSECSSFQVDEEKLVRAGLVKGDWLRTLQKNLRGTTQGNLPLNVLWQREEGIVEEAVENQHGLYEKIRGERPEASIGYITDIDFNNKNIEKILSLMKGVTLLVCECSFLKKEKEKARNSAHLCSDDVNFLIDKLRPAFFLPMHLSKSYIHTWENLFEELNIPPDVTLVRLPKYLTPQPLLPCEARKIVRKT